MPEIVAVIPARYASTRLPGKPLLPLCGKPLIQHVWEGVLSCKSISRVLIATDDERIATAARTFGAEVRMTRADHPSGTDRMAEAVKGIHADWFLNVQGDEPLISKAILDPFLAALGRFDMATLARRMGEKEDFRNPNVVKVAFGADGRALYFSRSPIPYPRDSQPGEYWHHLGIYAYRPAILETLVSLPPARLEQVEKLEQLRALENGIAIQVVPTSFQSVGVDTPEDVPVVERLLSERTGQP